MYHLFQYDICREKIKRVKELLEINKLSNMQLMNQVKTKENQFRTLSAVNLKNKSLLENHLQRISYHTRDTEKEASDNLRHYSQSREVQRQHYLNFEKQGPPPKALGGFDTGEVGLCRYNPGKGNDKHHLLTSHH
jgi:hypothetical protein